jgi:aldose sugar dehydrogenase
MLTRVISVAALGGLLGFVTMSSPRAQDVSGVTITPRLDTPQARVIVATLQPHMPVAAKTGHATNRVLIYLDDGRMTVKEGDRGSTVEFHRGDVRWRASSGAYVAENTGDHPVRILEIDLKEAASTGAPPPALDPARVDPQHYKVEFENEQVRVLRIHYDAHEKGQLHEHTLNRVVVYLNDQSGAKADDVRVAGAAKHVEENASDRAADRIAVELKSGAAAAVPAVARPPVIKVTPETGSAAPDGYAPIPQWLGQTRAPRPAKTAEYKVESVVEGLAGAFCFSFLPDGRILVGERSGHVKIAAKDGKVSEVSGLPPNLFARGGQGLYEVRADRAFATNRTIYLTYTVLPDGSDPSALPRSPGVLLAARATLSADDSRLENVKTLLDAEGTGGRLAQAPDGTLLITSTVPAGVGINSVDWPQPQQLDSDMGKVLRINADGSIPKDNPFVGRSGAHPEIYALGFRDPQGITIHPRTGKLWTSEHGPRGGDEINAVAKGKNYGFPVIGYGREYSGKPINGDKTSQEGMEQPVYFWTPDIAPAGIAFYTGKLFPAWNGDLFVATLVGRSLVRLAMNDERVVGEERLLTELNARIRGVNEGPDGALYVLTDGANGKILRLSPK